MTSTITHVIHGAMYLCQAEHLLQRDPGLVFRLVIVAAGGHSDIAKLLLAHGAETSSYWESGTYAPLNAAAIGGHGGIVKALLDAGADCKRAPSPLYSVKDPDVLGVLLEAGADVNAMEWTGETPLTSAVGCGHFEVRCPAHAV